MSKWIDVNDRLPEMCVVGVSKWVLVTAIESIFKSPYVKVAHYTIDGWYDLNGEQCKVVAWQVLPEPYGQEETK